MSLDEIELNELEILEAKEIIFQGRRNMKKGEYASKSRDLDKEYLAFEAAYLPIPGQPSSRQ